jgi:hypothetical protein
MYGGEKRSGHLTFERETVADRQQTGEVRMQVNTARPANGQPAKTVTGQRIARATTYTKKDRARDAALWRRRKLDIDPPTIALAARIFGISQPMVKKECDRLAQQDRRRNGSPIPPPTDHEADRLVQWLGPERVMAALDRATQPPLPFSMAAE